MPESSYSESPYEELEYLADYLPSNGESIVVSRRDGELVCEPVKKPRPLDPLEDPALYGRLVQINERLQQLWTMPIVLGLVGWFWLCVGLHVWQDAGLSGWFLDVGFGLMIAVGVSSWIQQRQRLYFRQAQQESLSRQLRQARIDHHTLIGALRHHPELRTLFSQLVRWN
ncbi:MAG: hypothetical protein C0478_15100 [Planctomyces sp.]|jgi:hypothetical protein|nr:hypothetical protein [Planctomyces sp.]